MNEFPSSNSEKGESPATSHTEVTGGPKNMINPLL